MWNELVAKYTNVQLYLHFWGMTTSVPEVMNSLHNLVANRKVLYLGISDTPAWVVVKCNACKLSRSFSFKSRGPSCKQSCSRLAVQVKVYS